MSRYITRKEIAAANEVSCDTIARLEKKLGLDKCQDQACARPVRYHAEKARKCLRDHNFNEP